MTDDIVDRLDASYEFLRDPLHLEARDEIERLRLAMRDAARYLDASRKREEVVRLAMRDAASYLDALEGGKTND
jgi:hypothetical protein